jgi:hypothetical protein
MLKQMTIAVEEDVYNTLAPFAERHTLSDFIAQLVRSRNPFHDEWENAPHGNTVKPLRGLFKDCVLTTERFLEMKREDEKLERELTL